MYVWSLDSVNVARDQDGRLCVPMIDLARRALKLSILLGEPIEVGEPHLIDNTFLLQELAEFPAFRKVLNDYADIRFFLSLDGAPATPREILCRKLATNGWATSAWRVTEQHIEGFGAWLESGRGAAPQITDPEGARESAETDALIVEGLVHLDGIIGRKRESAAHRLGAPQFGGGFPTLCDRIDEGVSTLNERIELGDRHDEWVSDDERAECSGAHARLTALRAELDGVQRRTVWLDRLAELAQEQEDAWSWTDEIARCVVNNAYNKVVASSFGSSQVFAAESPIFLEDAQGVDQVGPRTIDAMHSLWEPDEDAPGTSPPSHPYLDVQDLDALDRITWDMIDDAIESSDFHRARAQLADAPDEERAERRLAFAQTVAGRVALGWTVQRDSFPGNAIFNDFENKRLEGFVRAGSSLVARAIGDQSGFISANSEVIRVGLAGGIAWAHNRLARTASRKQALRLQGRIERLLMAGRGKRRRAGVMGAAWDRYLALRAADPALFAAGAAHPIEILTAPEDVRQAVEVTQQRLAKAGDPEEWAEVGVVYEDQYLRVIRDPVRFPGGDLGTYIRIIGPRSAGGVTGAAVLPVVAGRRVVLLRHYRHATRSWHLEIPRGFADPGESCEDAARRELKEELGPAGKIELTPLGEMHTNTGLSADVAHLFLASCDSWDPEAPRSEAASGQELSPDEFRDRIRSGGITDSFTIAAWARATALGLLPG